MKDAYIPEGPWKFNSSVTGVFTDMISRSIPSYIELRSTISRLIRNLSVSDSVILDIGCSNGIQIEHLYNECANDTQFIGYDNSESFLVESRKKFSTFPRVKIEYLDLEQEFTMPSSTVILCIFTLQFVSVSHRKRILEQFYKSLSDEGLLFWAEKVKGEINRSDQLLVETYHKYKEEAGYSIEQIFAKQESLKNVLVPLTSKENQELLRQVGFESIDVVWASLNFNLYAAYKKEKT